MKAHIGADAGTGYVHSVSATAANVHDPDEAHRLVRDDDEVSYGDAASSFSWFEWAPEQRLPTHGQVAHPVARPILSRR